MAQSIRRFVVGDYVVEKQIGSGSFSTVYHARHRVRGTEVAIKEIITARLDKKLQENLKSEIVILQKINHPNIIRLHHMIEEAGKIYIVLEYCRGGDLSMYIRRQQGRIPEATAKHFMQQLASGLKILRENNLIHRDLKPQNLLLSAMHDNSTLKIADFGFARSLDPKVLAETLCGSPLYMAPEIMQLQKYDAKADLWSVGAILFQLVTGKTPFTGNNQIQLLQNIVKSIELQFPLDAKNLSLHCTDLCRKLLRRNPVERLTFEEFFNHPFLAQEEPDELSWNQRPQRVIDGFSLTECNPVRSTVETFQEDGLPYRREVSGTPNENSFVLDCSNIMKKSGTVGSSHGQHRHPEGKLKESSSMDPRLCSKVADSFELIEREYVLVSGSLIESSSSAGGSRVSYIPFSSSCSLQASMNIDSTVGPATNIIGPVPKLESPSSVPGASSTDIESLLYTASAITELVNEKISARRHLEAFSIELVMLAIWKHALRICQTQAASVAEERNNQFTAKTREIWGDSQVSPNIEENAHNSSGQDNVFSHIKRAFLSEIGKAEELSKHIDPGNTEVPDAMEMIFQFALDFGRKGAVDEYMGRTENAVGLYSKAVRLLAFLQVEAPLLMLNPPFSLTISDHNRLGSYIDVLRNRQTISRSQMTSRLKREDQHCVL